MARSTPTSLPVPSAPRPAPHPSPAPRRPWRKLLRDNGLSLVLGGAFLLLWAGQAIAGWRVFAAQERLHRGVEPAFSSYLATGHFWQATAENWESEFLQMAAYVVLTCFLFQRGSAESKDPDAPEEKPGASTVRASFWKANGLSLAFAGLFLAAFVTHAIGGLAEHNDQRVDHGLPRQTFAEFLSGADFWFQSLQNWQSEFLAVFSLVVLSIFLRQRGSPESKPVDAPVSKTGK